MTDKTNPIGIGSRILRERAMAVLRETRAKIDPRLLLAMKDHLSAVMPQPEEGTDAKKETVFKREKEAVKAPVVSADVEPVDRQKIAQIVLQYMKNREDTRKH